MNSDLLMGQHTLRWKSNISYRNVGAFVRLYSGTLIPIDIAPLILLEITTIAVSGQ